MPTFKGNLSVDEIAAVVRHERETLSGEKTPSVDKQVTAEQIVNYLKDHPATS